MVHIYAEITAGGEDLVLVAGGPGTPADVARAAKQLEPLTAHFSKTDPPGGLRAPLTWPTVVQLSQTYGPDFIPGEQLRAWIAVQSHIRTTALPTGLSFPVPAGYAPRDYQVEGALEIARTGRTLIFDEPRTGKTWTTILGLLERDFHGHAWICSSDDWACECGWFPSKLGRDGLHQAWRDHVYAEARGRGPVIVVCPASVIDPWVETWQMLAPHLTTVAWRGPKRQLLAGTADVYVTSYDTARIDTPRIRKAPLPDLGARALVVDECHYIKNNDTGRTKAVDKLAQRVEAFVALSGTPITHHPGNLWPTLKCLAPGAYPAKARWVDRYCSVDPYAEYGEGIIGLSPLTEPEFRVTILGQHRRVARADVMSQLPPKVYSQRTVELPSAWRKAYDQFESQMLAELPDGQELSVMDALSVFTHLSGLASAAADVRVEFGPDVDEQTGEPKRHVHLDLKAPSWKVDALLEILDERCRQDAGETPEKVVVFAPSRQLIDLAGAAAEKAGYRVGYVVGGQSAGARTEAIRSFQQDPEGVQVILATTQAGGTGITLSAAGTLVFLQRPWSLVESLQAEDRAEGDPNATRGTEVIDVVARNTIDSRVRAVLRERAGQLSELLQDPRIVTELLGGSRHTEPERKSA